MNPVMPLAAKRGMALAILAIVALLIWNVVVWPIIDLAISRRSDVAALSDRLDQLRAVERRAPILGKREQAAVAGLQSLGIFWSGPSDAAISASMEDLIRAASQQSGGLVSSSSALPDIANARGMLGIRARVDGLLDTLQHVLVAVDTSRPKLFLSNLAVSVVSPATKDHPTQISFEVSVSGYVTVTHAP